MGTRAPAGGRRRVRGRGRLDAGPRPAAPAGVGAPGALLTELATTVVTPLRTRLEARSVDRRPDARPTSRSRSPSASAPATGSGGAKELEGAARRRAGARPTPGARTTPRPTGPRLRWVPAVSASAPTATTTRSNRRHGATTSRPASRTRPRTRAVAASLVVERTACIGPRSGPRVRSPRPRAARAL